MLRGRDVVAEPFADYVRERGEHHLRVAMPLARAAEDLVQASLVKLYRAWRGSTPTRTWTAICGAS